MLYLWDHVKALCLAWPKMYHLIINMYRKLHVIMLVCCWSVSQQTPKTRRQVNDRLCTMCAFMCALTVQNCHQMKRFLGMLLYQVNRYRRVTDRDGPGTSCSAQLVSHTCLFFQTVTRTYCTQVWHVDKQNDNVICDSATKQTRTNQMNPAI